MMERREGWYWVKDLDGWKCAEWKGGGWFVGWSEYASSDFPFDEIGPRIPTPDEPWQCVPAKPTLEMQKAYFESIDENMQRVQTDLRFGRFDNQRLGYQRMLAAAPSPGGA